MPFQSCFRTLCCSALLTHAALAQQPPAPLELDAALALAEQRAPLLRASEAAAQAARERAVAAAERPDPVLRLGVANLPVEGAERWSLTRDAMTTRSIGLAQEFTRADKRRARAASHDADAALALAGRDARLALLRHETATAWLERHDLERLRTLLLLQRDEARLGAEAAEAAYRGGGGGGGGQRGAQADVFSARAEVALLDDRIAAVDARIAQAQFALERWVGPERARAPLGPRPDVDVLPVSADALAARLAELPALAALDRQVAKAEADVEVARTESRTDWSAELMVEERSSRYGDMLSITLSRPLAIEPARRQQREVAARLQQLEQLRAERDDLLREQRERIAAWQRDWTSARERGALHERELIPLAAERTRAVLAAYRAGNAPLAAVLDARRAEVAARVERLQLDADAARVWARLAHLLAHPFGHLPGGPR